MIWLLTLGLLTPPAIIGYFLEVKQVDIFEVEISTRKKRKYPWNWFLDGFLILSMLVSALSAIAILVFIAFKTSEWILS